MTNGAGIKVASRRVTNGTIELNELLPGLYSLRIGQEALTVLKY